MNVGDIYWVEFPIRGGHAQAGRRPAIVVQHLTALPTKLLIPLTSQQDALRFPATILIEPDNDTGLRQPSVALVFQMTAVDKRYISERVGRIPAQLMDDIWFAFDELTGRSA